MKETNKLTIEQTTLDKVSWERSASKPEALARISFVRDCDEKSFGGETIELSMPVSDASYHHIDILKASINLMPALSGLDLDNAKFLCADDPDYAEDYTPSGVLLNEVVYYTAKSWAFHEDYTIRIHLEEV